MVASSFLSPTLCQPGASSSLSKKTEFQIDMIEVSLQGASGAPHYSCASLHSDVNTFWNTISPIAENDLHHCSRCSKARPTQIFEKYEDKIQLLLAL